METRESTFGGEWCRLTSGLKLEKGASTADTGTVAKHYKDAIELLMKIIQADRTNVTWLMRMRCTTQTGRPLPRHQNVHTYILMQGWVRYMWLFSPFRNVNPWMLRACLDSTHASHESFQRWLRSRLTLQKSICSVPTCTESLLTTNLASDHRDSPVNSILDHSHAKGRIVQTNLQETLIMCGTSGVHDSCRDFEGFCTSPSSSTPLSA